MTKCREGNIEIIFPPNAKVRRFDDSKSHGLSHCMKAVDFIVEEPERTLFIEFKDPKIPLEECEDPKTLRARKQARKEFIAKFTSGGLDQDLKYKYRDSFLYEWASGRMYERIHYWVLIGIDELTSSDLGRRTDDLKGKLPASVPSRVAWKHRIVHDCLVLYIDAWNNRLPDYPVSRIAP